MNMYMVLKVTRQSKNSHCAVFLDMDKKYKVHLCGNLPDLYNGMFIKLEVQKGEKVVEDYELTLTEKNLKILEKNEVNIEEYSRTLEAHSRLKSKGISWYIASSDNSEEGNVYDRLPFSEADKVHKEMVDNPKDESRLRAINREIVEEARRDRKIEYAIQEYFSYFDDVESEGAYQHLMLSVKALCLQAKTFGFKNGKILDNEMKAKEAFVNENIRERIKGGFQICTKKEIAEFVQSVKGGMLCQEQIDTIWCLEGSYPNIITGGAGVGKTSVIKAIIDCYAKFYNTNNILLVAPTGKASRRLTEKTHLPAKTIHAALRKSPEDNYIHFTDTNPLPCKLVIIDESSMIDTALMYDLLKAVPKTAKIIFVGDHNQLYPVGYGEPFFEFLDLFKQFDLVYYLKENHRQEEGTDILEAAMNVLNNAPIWCGRGVLVKEIEWEEMGDIFEENNFDEGSSVQIISPFNALNAKINAHLRKGNYPFNVGDKIMTVKNTENYCNGDIGYVTKIDPLKDTMTINIEGKSIDITEKHMQEVTLAYAITVHKMQGSEAEKVIVFLPKNKNIDKRMLYTAVTRARKELEIYYY